MDRQFWLASWIASVTLAGQCAGGADDSVTKHVTYDGYFVSNKFEPDAGESVVANSDQKQFDEVFGVAFVMRDKAHRIPQDAFLSSLVLGVVKRGMATWEFRVNEVVEADGKLEIRYSAKSSPQPSATFASPLIVGVPKKDYSSSVTFVKNKKPIKTLKLTTDKH